MIDTNAHQMSDHSLMTRISQRDQSALAELYDQYGSRMYAIALRITGDHKAAEEVVIEVFRSVWQLVEHGDPSDGVALRLLTLVGEQSRTMLKQRSNGIRVVGNLHTDGQPAAQLPLHKSQPTLPLAQAALCRLSSIQRQALELAYYDQRTQAEIALQLDMPLSRVRTEMRQGLMQLRELVVADGTPA